MPKPWQLQEAQTLLIAHRLEEGTDLKKKTCSASLKHYLPIFLCARCCSGRETPDDLYGNRDELADTPRFSSPFSNNRTRLYQDTPQAPPPFQISSRITLEKALQEKPSKLRLSWGLCLQPIGRWLCSTFNTFAHDGRLAATLC